MGQVLQGVQGVGLQVARAASELYYSGRSRLRRGGGYDPTLPGGQLLQAVDRKLQQEGKLTWDEVVQRADRRVSVDRERERLARKLKARDPTMNVTVVRTPLPSPTSPQYATIQKLLRARAGIVDHPTSPSSSTSSSSPTRIPARQTTTLSPLSKSSEGESRGGGESGGGSTATPRSSFRRKTHQSWSASAPPAGSPSRQGICNQEAFRRGVGGPSLPPPFSPSPRCLRAPLYRGRRHCHPRRGLHPRPRLLRPAAAGDLPSAAAGRLQQQQQ